MKFISSTIRYVLTTCVLLSLSNAAPADQNKYEEGRVYRHTLANGMKVLTMERHIAPLIYHQLTYNVGSRNEKLGTTGISHVVEHMMFKGTPKYGKGQTSKIISKNSGVFNAFTSNDMTSYYEYLPASKIEVAMDIESDRMMNCTFNADEIKSEIEVIIQERRMRSERGSQGIMREVMNSMVFYSHPNRDPIIGWPGDLRHITVQDAYAYYKAYYNPNNAFLVLVGDFQTDDILKMVGKYYGVLPAGIAPEEPWSLQEKQRVRKTFTLYHNDIAQRSFRMGFVVPNLKDSDAPALRMAGAVFCAKSRDSRLYKRLVDQRGLVSSVAGGFAISKDPTIFSITATMKPDSSIDEAERLIWEEIEVMKKDSVTDHELQKAKNKFNFIQKTNYTKNKDIGTRISQYEAYYGWEYSDVFIKKVLTVNKSEIIAVMKKYFNKEQVTIAYAFPKGKEKQTVETDAEDQGTEPQFQAEENDLFYYQSPEFQGNLINAVNDPVSDDEEIKEIAPLIKKMKLKNGITLYAIENHLIPTLNIVGTIETGVMPENLEGEKPGIVGLLADVMSRETKELSPDQLTERLSFVPFSFNVGGSFKSFYFQGNALIENADEMMTVGYSMVHDPVLAPAQIEKLRSRHVLQAKDRLNTTSLQAFYYMYNKIFEGHPLTKYFSTEQSVNSITRQDLVGLYKKYFNPRNLTLLMVGDMSSDKMKELAERYYGQWSTKSEPVSFMKVPKAKELKEKIVKVFTEKDYAECTINIGFAPTNDIDNDEEEIMSVMNHIIAGSALTSRIGVELRDKQGLIYGIKSQPWTISLGVGYWKISSKTAPKNTTKVITGIFKEIKKLLESGVTDEELETAKNRQLGLLPFMVETPDDVASRIFELLQDKKPLNFFDKKTERIKKITKGDVLRIAKKYFTVDRFVIVVDGPIDEKSLDGLADQL